MATSPKNPLSRWRLANVGAHRGARANLSALAEHDRHTSASRLVVDEIDPVPGRAEETAVLARRQGLDAHGTEGRGEALVHRDRADGVIANVDNAATVAATVEAMRREGVPGLGYLLLRLPDTRLLALRFALGRDEGEHAALVSAYFTSLAKVTARSGSAAVFGEGAPATHALLERAQRRWFAAHTRAELGRMVAGVPSEHGPFEASFNGAHTLPVLVVPVTTYDDPERVVERAVAVPSTPIARGTELLVAEVAPEGIRLHEARRRVVDGETVVRRSTGIDPFEVRRLLPTRPALAEALAREGRSESAPSMSRLFGEVAAEAAREGTTVSRRSVRTNELSVLRPVFTTD